MARPLPSSTAMRTHSLLLPSLLASLLIAACSSTSDTGSTGDASTCTGTPPVMCDGCCGAKYAADSCESGVWSCRPLGIACVQCDAGADSAPNDASGDSAACTGTPPLTCDGCCGAKYAADLCDSGVWTCRPLGAACIQCDAGADSAPSDASGDSAACTGTAPLCFGSDTSVCCGNDPSGSAVCSGGAWKCGSAPAPGCDGTSCLAQDAGPG